MHDEDPEGPGDYADHEKAELRRHGIFPEREESEA